ncbi:MAG: hypothetical protein HWE26_20365 [Alteromonadaceae bacterium]|nr:hypothetical protein [Alteromonadaceae bacterium]
MKQVKKNSVASAIGAVVIGSSLSTVAFAADAANPFEVEQLDSGYMQFIAEGSCGGDKADKEGKCGEGKCGGDKAKKEGKCGEGKCGGDKAKKEGKCGSAA